MYYKIVTKLKRSKAVENTFGIRFCDTIAYMTKNKDKLTVGSDFDVFVFGGVADLFAVFKAGTEVEAGTVIDVFVSVFVSCTVAVIVGEVVDGTVVEDVDGTVADFVVEVANGTVDEFVVEVVDGTVVEVVDGMVVDFVIRGAAGGVVGVAAVTVVEAVAGTGVDDLIVVLIIGDSGDPVDFPVVS